MEKIIWTLHAKTLFFLSIFLFIYGYLFTNLISVLSGASILIFLVYVKYSFSKDYCEITIQRNPIEKLFYVNHPLNIKTIIRNNGGPINLSIIDKLPETVILLKGKNILKKKCKPHEECELSYQIKFLNRGKNKLTKIEGIIADNWNLFSKKINIDIKTDFMVHSDPNEITKAKRTSMTDENIIALPSMIGAEITHELEGIREYMPGDLLKDIDWKASSRLQKLLTKIFIKKETLESIILIDCSKNMRKTSGKYSKIEHAILVAIHLTSILQSMNNKVGTIVYDEFKVLNNIQPTRNYHQIFKEFSQLPSIIKTKKYLTKQTATVDDFSMNESEENQEFLNTIYPFISSRKYNIKHRIQTTGIYEAINNSMNDSIKKHLIIITDMETNINALYASITLAHTQNYKIWLLYLFTPSYQLSIKQLNTEKLEELYIFKMSQEKLIQKFKKKNIEIVEINPIIEGSKIIEIIRRKKS